MTLLTKWNLYRERLGLPGALVAAAALLLCVAGVFVAASVDATTDGSTRHAARQFVRVLIALPVCGLVFLAPPRWIRVNAYVFYGVTVVLLAAVLAVGPVVNGARRWLGAGSYRFQPSDLAKLALCLTLARFLTLRSRAASAQGVLVAAILTAVPALLIVKEPDLGTALNLLPVFLATIFVAGARRRHLTFVLLTGVVVLGLYMAFGLHNYQNDRIQVWFKQDSLTRPEKLAEGYHLHRSKIAVGSGGVLGYGFAEGPQNKNDLLPERHTDFVFSVFSEEWGFAGASLLLLIELALPVGLLWLAYRVRDPFARNAIVAIGTQIGAQALVNMGVATGTFPTTGIALPLVSFGGSSAVVTCVAITIALQLAAKAEPALAADAFEAEEEETSLTRRR